MWIYIIDFWKKGKQSNLIGWVGGAEVFCSLGKEFMLPWIVFLLNIVLSFDLALSSV